MTHLKLLLVLLLLVNVQLRAQTLVGPVDSIALVSHPPVTASKIWVRRIEVVGNKKTKTALILREIQFKPGDSLPLAHLTQTLALAHDQVYNTTLFNEVTIAPIPIGASQIDVLVTVKERWYLYPIPQFQPIDRNLNEWLVKYKGDLSRVNYGIKLVDYNLTGRRDVLRIYLLDGYTRNIAFSYSQPFSSEALTSGFVVGAGYAQSREIAYQTSYNNKLQFYSNGHFVRSSWVFSAGYSIRKAIKTRHIFSATYTIAQINDSIVLPKYNPNYFQNASKAQSFIELSYNYRYSQVNNVAYPLTGVNAFATLSKRGLGFSGNLNLLAFEGSYARYHDFSKKWYGSLQWTGKIKLPFDQPYFNQRGIGYGDATLRGLEYYVVDAAAYMVLKSTLKKQIAAFRLPAPIRSSYVPHIPFTIFAKAFADLGYGYNHQKYPSYLGNKLLYTGGVGIDMVSLYDFHLKMEYSLNQLGQNGLFLQFQGGF